jgi:hypothetical protein
MQVTFSDFVQVSFSDFCTHDFFRFCTNPACSGMLHPDPFVGNSDPCTKQLPSTFAAHIHAADAEQVPVTVLISTFLEPIVALGHHPVPLSRSDSSHSPKAPVLNMSFLGKSFQHALNVSHCWPVCRVLLGTQQGNLLHTEHLYCDSRISAMQQRWVEDGLAQSALVDVHTLPHPRNNIQGLPVTGIMRRLFSSQQLQQYHAIRVHVQLWTRL